MFFVMGAIGAALIRNPPPGYRPKGWTPPPAAAGAGRDLTPAEMLRTPTFYPMWVSYCLGATAGLIVISQLVPFARNSGMAAAAATLAITIGAFGNAGGRILSGWLSDTLGRLTTLRTMVLVSAVAMPVWVSVRESTALFYVLVVVVY